MGSRFGGTVAGQGGASSQSSSRLSRRVAFNSRLHLEVLEERQLLHAGHEHTDPDPGVTMPGHDLPGSEYPIIAEALNSLSSIPVLNSLPGAAVSVYLDFDGFFEANWGSYNNITTPVFDRDGDPTSFSDTELANIQEIWSRVAEDYSPFKVNVTTVEPPSFANGKALRVAIGGDGAWTNQSIGGIAYVNDFTSSVPNTVYVFPKKLSSGNPKSVAEASSHEAGHAFGLDHQSQYNASGVKIAEYYAGAGDGRAPIMGNSYSATRGLWWNGTSSDGATIMQDDLGIISRPFNGFGYRTDDHGNTAGTATPLTGSNTLLVGSGIITTTSDVDYFSFDTGAGQVTLNVTVPANINNLDARLELRDANGLLIASAAPSNSFNATIVTTVQAGSYRVVVGSQGNYGDIGQYTVSASVLAASVSGTVFVDANRNGTLDIGESKLPGWTVFDDVNQNGIVDQNPTTIIPSTDTPLQLTEPASTSSFLNVGGLPGAISAVKVHLTIHHPRASDLIVILQSPTGSSISLIVHNGDGADFLDTTLDSAAALSLSEGVSPFTGSFRPIGNLATLIGKTPNGTWRLQVSDQVSGEIGVLDSWSLEITTDTPETSTITDALGRYLFAFGTSGTHHLRELPQGSYVPTAPVSGVYNVDVIAGTPYTNLDFGNAVPGVVMKRATFYNESVFDGYTPGPSPLDDNAIATDKSAYLPGSGTATFANITSYTRGLNGIIIDIANLGGPIDGDDFIFKVGANNTPDTWDDAPAPGIDVRPGAGEGGSDRITLSWADGEIRNTWLQVTVKGNDELGNFDPVTGLPSSDVFYFGNRVGDTGSGTASQALTTLLDEIAARDNIGAGATVTNLYDFDRSGLVTAVDALAARFNAGALKKISVGNIIAAPEAPAMPLAFALTAVNQPATTPSTTSLSVGGQVAGVLTLPLSSEPSPLAETASRVNLSNRLTIRSHALHAATDAELADELLIDELASHLVARSV